MNYYILLIDSSINYKKKVANDMFVEEIKSKRNNKTYTSVLVRESYRNKGKVLHRTLANLSKLPQKLIAQIKRLIREEAGVFDKNTQQFQVSSSREYGASYAIWHVAKALELDKLIYSRSVQWREDVMAMIVGRIVYQGSKLKLTNLYNDTALWELAGHESLKPVDVDKHCYEAMDRLLERKDSIEKALAGRHIADGYLILYDMTSVYMEGAYETSQLVAFGKPRDGKRGHEQIAIGLLTDKKGCPVAVEVFAGNTSDQTTVEQQAKKLAEKYNVKKIIFAGDRGMLTPKRIEEVSALEFGTLTTLTHPALIKLYENKVIQLSMFDQKNITQIYDPDNPKVRYLLCKNPDTAARESKTRNSLVAKTKELMTKLSSSTRKQKVEKLSASVGKVLNKYKVGKFFEWHIEEGKLKWDLKTTLLELEQSFDGCYIVRTDVSEDIMDKQEAVNGYRQLQWVEQAFRNLKTVSLEIRPIYHHLDDRIRAHVFLCMLAYYVQWHMVELLAPLFANDGDGSERRWSVKIVIQRLCSIRKEKAYIGGINVGDIITRPDEEQQYILELLKVKL